MKFKNLYLGIIASAFLFASCTDNDNADNDVSLGAYENGVFTAKIMLRIQKTAVSHP